MAKKKKGAARLLEDWSAQVEENEAVFHAKVKATARRQLARKQQRRVAQAGEETAGSDNDGGSGGGVPATAGRRGSRLQLELPGSDSEAHMEGSGSEQQACLLLPFMCGCLGGMRSAASDKLCLPAAWLPWPKAQ